GPDTDAAVDDLVPLLGDRSERIRREASAALGRLGPAAVGPLIAASGHDDAAVRARAVEALGHLPTPDERAARALVERARDRAPEVRAAAVRSLARLTLPDDVLVPILDESLRHEGPDVRLAAVDFLVARGALLARVMPELESLLKGDDDGAARNAAYL